MTHGWKTITIQYACHLSFRSRTNSTSHGRFCHQLIYRSRTPILAPTVIYFDLCMKSKRHEDILQRNTELNPIPSQICALRTRSSTLHGPSAARGFRRDIIGVANQRYISICAEFLLHVSSTTSTAGAAKRIFSDKLRQPTHASRRRTASPEARIAIVPGPSY